MLRVTIQDDEQGTAFKLEGKLAYEWVAEAERAWREFSSKPRERVVVDLCGVSFVDDAGRELLGRMHASGASLIGTGPMTRALVEEICGDSRRSGRKWVRSALSVLLLLLVSAITRQGGALAFVRGALTGHLVYGVSGWIFSLENCLSEFWKGLS